jgi:tRNA pseudouridine13 synthase
MKQYGLQCGEGDLVAVNAAYNLEPARENWDGNESVEHLEGFENEEVPSDTLEELPNGSEQVLAAEGNAFQSAKHHGTVHVLTADDLASGRFSIKDVVLPIVGADSILPGNEIGSFYTELLARDGLTLGSFSTCVPVYRMSGAYRRLLQLPLDFSWRIMHYADPNAELAVTELTDARRRGDAGVAPEVAGAKGAGVVLDVAGTDASGPLQAVQLEFTLPPGTYATMLLRELTKESTETQFQAQLTAQEGRRAAAEVAEREDRDCEVDKTNGNTSKKQRVDEKDND